MCVSLAVEVSLLSVSLLVLCCKLRPSLPLLIAWPERQQVPSQGGVTAAFNEAASLRHMAIRLRCTF